MNRNAVNKNRRRLRLPGERNREDWQWTVALTLGALAAAVGLYLRGVDREPVRVSLPAAVPAGCKLITENHNQ